MVVCNCKYCGKKIEMPEGIHFEGSLKESLRYIEDTINEKSKSCECQTEHYYFEDNRNKYNASMLDDEIEEGATMSIRDWLEYGISCGYIEDVEDFTKLSTSQLSHMIDTIDYLETK